MKAAIFGLLKHQSIEVTGKLAGTVDPKPWTKPKTSHVTSTLENGIVYPTSPLDNSGSPSLYYACTRRHTGYTIREQGRIIYMYIYIYTHDPL